MTGKRLRYGYTTGACAAAAAKGAAMLLREQRVVDDVGITLPRGEAVRFALHGQQFTSSSASCFVVKDAGDDPDITNGAQIHALVTLTPASSGGKGGQIILEGGTGIGRVTKPGLAVPVGEWAINPVPRQMIVAGVTEVFPIHPFTLQVIISIPNGAELAQKTLNARLGIIGGLSILGTTGIVKPISAKAWTDTIDAAIDVAVACGSRTVVLSTGRSSELVAQKHLWHQEGTGSEARCPEEAFVMMGDYVGYALRACAAKGVRQIILAGQFAKLLKIACGHEQTHVSSSELDLRMLADWLDRAPVISHLAPLAVQANTARQLLVESSYDPALLELVCGRAKVAGARLAPLAEVKVLLAGYNSEVLYSV